MATSIASHVVGVVDLRDQPPQLVAALVELGQQLLGALRRLLALLGQRR